MSRLKDRVAVVTGAGRGIGRGIALALAREGAAVVLAARSQDALEATAGEIEARGGRAMVCPTDLTQPAQVDALFERVSDNFQRLDLLVNNAGAFDGGPIDELTDEAWDRVVAVNLSAPFRCTRAAFRIMKPQRRGRIINIGSISAQRVRPHSAAYSASKFGIWGLTQVSALEGREHGITCGCVHPGNTLVERREGTGADEDAEPMMSVDAIADLVVSMAALPDDVNLLEAIVLPRDQDYIGRG